MRSLVLASVFAVSALVACGGSTTEIPDPEGSGPIARPTPGTSDPSNPSAPVDPSNPANPSDPASGPYVSVHVRATQAPFAHAPNTVGQTPSLQKMAWKSLTLFASKDDPNGYRVFDHGTAPVEGGLSAGDDTVVAKLPIKGLRAGRYTYARAEVSYVKYNVVSNMHSLGFTIPGTFENVQVLANGTMLDGQRRDKGFYRYTFKSAQLAPQSVEGNDAPLPQTTGAGGIALESGPNGLVYAFPIDMTIDLGVTGDLHAIFEVNTHENFRWLDQAVPGYSAGTYDTTPTSFEPVVSFGANSARLYWEQ